MLFTSLAFLTLFLPVVLTVSWVLAWAARRIGARIWRMSNAFLLLASLVFYFWGEGWGVALLLASIAANYLFGLALGRARRATARRAIVFAAIAANLAALFSFKYAALGARTANSLLGLSLPVPEIALPLGISFYTFQAMSYVIDVYRGDTRPQRSLIDFACYIAMFPQLVAGPIVRYSDIAASLARRQIDVGRTASGMRRFLVGLARKVVVANVVAGFADRAWSMVGEGMGLPAAYAWLALVCYTLQIYFDFSGYSDMAIGLGRMLGFEFPENFNYPYVSKSVREFWRRWHITLSSWFRDYLYIPLGGSRCAAWRACLNGLVVFALCGLWHGASAMFVLWGLWHGLFIMGERLAPRRPAGRWAEGLGWLKTQAAVMAGWILFRSADMGEAWLFIKSLAGVAEVAPQTRVLAVEASPLLFATAAVGAALAAGVAAKARTAFRERAGVVAAFAEWGAATVVALYALLLIVGGSYNPFIYFRF